MQLRQTSDGRLLAAVAFEPEQTDTDGAEAAAATLHAMRGMIKSDTPILPEAHVVGVRPIPKDGFPVLGRIAGISGLYVAVMHSGIRLAPAIGRFIAEEILIGRRDSLIEAYGLQRLL
jgi:glycine/D-amino acid oxidase-like deaminating enzyme